MAESKEKFKRCLSVLLVLDELEETEDRASKRDKTREWIRRRQESGYFTNIVRELAAEDAPRIYRVPLRSKNMLFLSCLSDGSRHKKHPISIYSLPIGRSSGQFPRRSNVLLFILVFFC